MWTSFLYQRIHDHVYHGKSTKYFFRKRLVRILPLYYLMTLGTYLSLLLFPSMFQQTRHDFPIWSKVCCLFLLISAAERSSLWYGLAGPLTVKCCSICCFHCLSHQHEIPRSDLQRISGDSGGNGTDICSGDLILAVSDR